MKKQDVENLIRELNLKEGDMIRLQCKIFIIKNSQVPWNYWLKEGYFIKFERGTLYYKTFNEEGYKSIGQVHHNRILKLMRIKEFTANLQFLTAKEIDQIFEGVNK